jgi:hypothetical protein
LRDKSRRYGIGFDWKAYDDLNCLAAKNSRLQHSYVLFPQQLAHFVIGLSINDQGAGQ